MLCQSELLEFLVSNTVVLTDHQLGLRFEKAERNHEQLNRNFDSLVVLECTYIFLAPD
jgi:hypothetical protein